jgi:Putative auto-transporter adhesin, head GIN domain
MVLISGVNSERSFSMKRTARFLSLIVAISLVITGCGLIKSAGIQVITPSDVIISETRDVSGFSSIDMGTIGTVVITQGNTESVKISGSDNLVPLIKTRVSNSTLVIDTDGSLNIVPGNINKAKQLTITIELKDLSSLEVSGLGDIQINALSTPSLAITMSGAGKVQIKQLTTDSLDLNLSGLGSVELSGEAQQATMDISGAGSVTAPDLKIQTVNVTVPGLGSATLWVTDKLTGNISGAGSISYYGNPQTNTNSTGLGSFKSLGSK